jgi:hypothetical protein
MLSGRMKVKPFNMVDKLPYGLVVHYDQAGDKGKPFPPFPFFPILSIVSIVALQIISYLQDALSDAFDASVFSDRCLLLGVAIEW